MFRKYVKRWFGLYDIEDLTVGGHCGCCGRWLPNEIVDKFFKWSLCDHGCKEKPKSRSYYDLYKRL